ncbi:C40 family peptidase [Paenibacillus hamazuiensis]|uniref:C40 family peptidase n=1 Tax=Paenibacillus hamazuiensis TaxID=2936508 RepID=UPI00200DF825|nr:C40 family peptidase [Paenibacillus hamazuiensis]
MKRSMAKKLMTATLSLSLLFAGGAVALPTSAHAATLAERIIDTGDNYMHTPYKFGAPAGSTRVFDCSSFTQYIFKKHGISLPRTSKQQSKVGRYVPRSQLQKGDLVFFSTRSSGGKVGHVGVYIGNGKILHTFGNPQGVTISNMKSGWWSNHYITARRVL